MKSHSILFAARVANNNIKCIHPQCHFTTIILFVLSVTLMAASKFITMAANAKATKTMRTETSQQRHRIERKKAVNLRPNMTEMYFCCIFVHGSIVSALALYQKTRKNKTGGSGYPSIKIVLKNREENDKFELCQMSQNIGMKSYQMRFTSINKYRMIRSESYRLAGSTLDVIFFVLWIWNGFIICFSSFFLFLFNHFVSGICRFLS